MSCLPSNPDISGIGVRIAIYTQNLLSFVPAVFALQDKHVSMLELEDLERQSSTILIAAFAILLSVIVQAFQEHGLTNYHAAIVLNLSWKNNTNLFIYVLLFFYHTVELRYEEEKDGTRPTPRVLWIAQTKKAIRNPVLLIGSAHLSLMAAVGLWLWSNPVAFSKSEPCSLSASLVVAGKEVAIGSSHLREWSLLIYSLLLTPGLNLVVPIGFFAVPVWVYSTFRPVSLNRAFAFRFTGVGLAILAVINVILLADTEVGISRNKGLTEAGDTDWTFGQTLALLLLLVPIRDIGEALLERRAKRMGTKLEEAARRGDLWAVQDAIKSGASKGAIGTGRHVL
jgi:hypothetical protein